MLNERKYFIKVLLLRLKIFELPKSNVFCFKLSQTMPNFSLQKESERPQKSNVNSIRDQADYCVRIFAHIKVNINYNI